MTSELVYVLAGGSLLLAVVLPLALARVAVSAPMVLLLVGVLVGLQPMFQGEYVRPAGHREFTEHLTEFTVLVALMGVGLALDRPLDVRSWRTFGRWGATWRLLAVAMPLCIVGVALLGWWVVGLASAAAVHLGAVLAPTDPVLASDVQVAGPSVFSGDEVAGEEAEIDEEDEVRFALTSEAGLNDGLTFPFVYLAIFMSTMGATFGAVAEWGPRWLGWELVGKTLLGALLGWVVGWVLAKTASGVRAPRYGWPRSGNRCWRWPRCCCPTASRSWPAATASLPSSCAR